MTKRNTATRDRHRAIIRRKQPDCGICGQSINYNLPHLDPGEFTVDHIIPYARGGPDTLDNKQAAHRACNRTKSDKLGYAHGKPKPKSQTYLTERKW